MGYAVFENEERNRWEGYGVHGPCDWPTCDEEVARGMDAGCDDHGTFKLVLNGAEISYDRFDDEPDADEEWVEEEGCSYFLCPEHRDQRHKYDHATITVGKPDTTEWVNHMLTDESWQEWRDLNPAKVEALTNRLAA